MIRYDCIAKTILVLVVLFAAAGNAQERWELVTENREGSRHYIDRESIVILEPGHFLIWEKFYPVGAERQGFLENELKPDPNAQDFVYLMSRTEIDCSLLQYRIHHATYYSGNGKSMKSVNEVSKWEHTPPGSTGEKALKMLCTKQQDTKDF